MTGAVATAKDLPIADYDSQTAQGIADKLNGFSQRELLVIGAYEAKHQNRTTVTDRIAKLTGDEPWSGYDEQNVAAITTAVAAGAADTAVKVSSYERAQGPRRCARSHGPPHKQLADHKRVLRQPRSLEHPAQNRTTTDNLTTSLPRPSPQDQVLAQRQETPFEPGPAPILAS
ncbi:MAG: hypothetical protein M3071_13045 [Actinomycetota bacterium]|nr:hypothetical protein [Actinomycetota bacterium]